MCEAVTKSPFSEEQESSRLQAVEYYLSNLKERLQKLRSKHDALIDDSVALIEEIDELSVSVMVGSDIRKASKRRPSSKIRKLIEEFDKTNKDVVGTQPKNEMNIAAGKTMKEIVLSFERINQSQVLQSTIKIFRKAKESFAKLDALMGHLNQIYNNKVNNAEKQAKSPNDLNFQEKLVMFDRLCKSLPTPKSKHSLLSNTKPLTVPNNSLIKTEKTAIISESSIKLEVENSKCEDLKQCSSEKIVLSDEEDSDHSDEEIQKVDVLITDKGGSYIKKNEAEKTDIEMPVSSSHASFKSIENSDTPEVPTKLSVSGYEGDCDDSEFCMYTEKKQMRQS